MSFHFGGLPTELLIKIMNELIVPNNKYSESNSKPKCDRAENLGDFINWGSTSSYFRNLLAPFIFHMVELQNEEKSAVSLYAVANGQLACLVRTMNFYGSAPKDLNYQDIDFEDTMRVFPESVGQILSNLQLFPCLETLSVEFSNDLDFWESIDMDYASAAISDEQVLNAEGTEARRALIAKTYNALANNKGKSVKSLILRDLTYKRVSTYTSRHFHGFLNHIEDFSISFSRGEMLRTREYSIFTSSLDETMFNHLMHVKSLTIKAPAERPLGGGSLWGSMAPLALKTNQMPFLESAYFEYIAICPQLIDFLIDHETTLKKLSLQNCFINMDEEETGWGICWEHFFDRLCNAQFRELCDVEIMPLNLKLCDEACESKEMPGGIHRMCQFERNPNLGRRLFSYAEFKHYRNMSFMRWDKILTAFNKDNDQMNYDRLMENVNSNAVKRFTSGQSPIRITEIL